MPKIEVNFEYGQGPRKEIVLLPKSDNRTPEEVAAELLSGFNRNIKDTDQERKLIECKVYSYNDHAHEWQMSTATKVSASQDVMFCPDCQATGIRFGFSKNVTPGVGFTHLCGKPKERKFSFK